MSKNRPEILDLLSKYGSIILRGFDLKTPEDFQDVLDSLSLIEFPYVGGAAPRNVVHRNVVTTNEAPPDAKIPFHHEMAQVKQSLNSLKVPLFPGKIFFFGQIPAEIEGGQTPICLSYKVYERIHEKHPEFIEKLERLGVVYTRVLSEEDDPESPIGRGWKSTFQTTDKEQAEKNARALGILYLFSLLFDVSLEWLPNGTVKSVSKVLPGIKEYQGKKQFFNSIVAAFTGWKDKRNDPTTAVLFGNGEKMDPQWIQDTHDIMNQICSDWKWQVGDLMMIDNLQVMHARRPFQGKRRILASLYE